MNNYNSYAPGCNVYGFNGGAAYTAPSPNFYQQQPQGQQQYVNPSEVMNMQNAFVNQMMVAQQQIQQKNQMQNNVYTNPYMQNPVQMPTPVMSPAQINGNMYGCYNGYNQMMNPYMQNNPYLMNQYATETPVNFQQKMYQMQMKWAKEALKEREKSMMGAAYINAITVRGYMRRAGYPEEAIEAEWKRLMETPLERAKRLQKEMEDRAKEAWDNLAIIRVEIYRNGKRVHTVIDDMTDEEIKVSRYGDWRGLANNVVFNNIGYTIPVEAIQPPRPYISPEMQKKIDEYNNLSMYDYFKYHLWNEHQACLKMEQRRAKQDKLVSSFDRNSYTNEVLKRQNLASKYNDGILKLTPENIEDVAYGTRLSLYTRWHSSGDIVDEQYLAGMCWVARKNKNVQYLAFTKQFRIVNKFVADGHKIPKNLHIVYSCWKNWVPENPYNFPTTWVYFPNKKEGMYNELIPTKAVPCSGKCYACQKCWELKKGESVVFRKH